MMREALSPPPYYHQQPSQQHPDYGMMHPGMPGHGNTVSRLGHPPPPIPGAGGLYTLGDLPSPASSFQLSMVDTSTPTNVHPRAGPPPSLRGGMGDMTGIKDLNHYLPVHKIKLEEYPRRLFTVENTVTRETIVAMTSTHKVALYILKIKSGEDAKNDAEKFEFSKFHDLNLQPFDLEGFAISQNCSITLVPFKLTYALSTRTEKTVVVYNQGSSNQVPDSLVLGDVCSETNPSPYISQFEHDSPVTHLAIDAEKEYLACIQELGTIIVWDINTKSRLAQFHIPNQGVFISFHLSEPYQLLVIDNKGWVRFFNVFYQTCFRSLHLVQPSVFSGEWSLSNSDILVAGFAESFAVINTSKPLTSLNKYYESPELVINAIKINPTDDKVYATLSRLTGTIQLWRDNFVTHIWKHRNPHVNDIAWVHGFQYLLALGHQTMYIYDSSVS